MNYFFRHNIYRERDVQLKFSKKKKTGFDPHQGFVRIVLEPNSLRPPGFHDRVQVAGHNVSRITKLVGRKKALERCWLVIWVETGLISLERYIVREP